MKVSPRRTRLVIWLKTLAVVAAYGFLIALVQELLLNRFFSSPILSLVLAFVLVQTAAVLYLLVRLLTAKTSSQIRLRRSERLDPWLRETLAEHALGADQLAALRDMKEKYPDNVESCLVQTLPSIRGSGLERLSQLASDLGLLQQWEHQATAHRAEERKQAVSKLGMLSPGVADTALLKALSDSHESVRLEASRALIRSANPSVIESIFSFSITQPLLVRAVLIEDLRPHITTLADRAIPRALSSSDPEHVRATLETLEVWAKFLPVANFSFFLRHSNPRIRAAAFRVLPYVGSADELKSEILEGLGDQQEEVKASAAMAAGRLRVEDALLPLLSCLRESGTSAALAAAYALAEIGAAGVETLEIELLSPNARAASVALDALGRAKLGRHDYAGL